MAMHIFFDPDVVCTLDLLTCKPPINKQKIMPWEWSDCYLNGVHLRCSDSAGMPKIELQHFAVGIPAKVEAVAIPTCGYLYTTIYADWSPPQPAVWYPKIAGSPGSTAVVSSRAGITQFELKYTGPPAAALDHYLTFRAGKLDDFGPGISLGQKPPPSASQPKP